MLTHLMDVSVRSLLLALPAVLSLWILRSRRTAALQHAVWTAVMCGTLALFAFGHFLPRLSVRIPGKPPAPALAIAMLYEGSTEAPPSPAHIPGKSPRPIDWTGVAAFAYGAVALAFLARFAAGVSLVRRLIARAGPAGDFLESDLIAIPLTVGWLRPRVLLPTEWRAWNAEKLEAVLAHERAHAGRRDALVGALAAVNRSVFWFHPLAWFLERKLALLAEQACDEHSIAVLGDREYYARLLLEMARTVDASHRRLRRHALTMAAPSHLRRRIDSLLEDGRTFSRGLTRPAWATIMLCAIPLVFAAGAADFAAPQATPAPRAQAAPAARFEVASVRRCTADQVAPGGAGGQKGGGGGRGGGGSASPDRLDIPCFPLRFLIRLAYVDTENRLNPDNPLTLEGGSPWIDSERYRIDAKAEGPVDRAVMQGPMLQALLEERFKLKVRRETRETALYALTVAASGLKLQKPGDLTCTEPDAGGPEHDGKPFVFLGCSKIQRAMEGACTPRDPAQYPPPPREPDDPPFCGVKRGLMSLSSSRRNNDLLGATMEQIARSLGSGAGRPVIDKTGITDKFDFHIEYAAEDSDPSNAVDAPPSIFAALRQLGLKLEPAKGPRDFLVIDHVERPSEN